MKLQISVHQVAESSTKILGKYVQDPWLQDNAKMSTDRKKISAASLTVANFPHCCLDVIQFSSICYFIWLNNFLCNFVMMNYKNDTLNTVIWI